MNDEEKLKEIIIDLTERVQEKEDETVHIF